MKALAVPALLALVLAVILLFVALPKILESGKLGSLFDPFGAKNTLASLEAGDDLEKAIKCAYARCFEGCGSPTVTNLEWRGGKCSDFCDLKYQENGKICNEKARVYPVEFLSPVETGVSAKIQADDLENYVSCIVPTPTDVCGEIGWGNELIGEKAILYLDRNAIKPSGSEPDTTGIIPFGEGSVVGIPLGRKCAGKFDSVKYGIDVVTIAVPGGTFFKVAKGLGTVTKITRGAQTAAITSGALGAEAFISQLKILKSAELTPGTLYLWANEDTGVSGFFKAIANSVASFTRGQTQNVVVCGVKPSECTEAPWPCEDRDRSLCNNGCIWETRLDKDVCANAPKPISCDEFVTSDSCVKQPGCCWTNEKGKKDCGDLYVVLKVPKDDENYKGFKRAIEKVGGVKMAETIWGNGKDITTINHLFKNPGVAGLTVWKDFKICNIDGVEFLPGDCAIGRVADGQKAYCYKGDFQYFPRECGCKTGYGTKIGKGELQTENLCQQFKADDIKDAIVDTWIKDENRNEIKVNSDGIDYQKITVAFLDTKDIVVTGISKNEVSFKTNLGTLEETNCIENGLVTYYSCSTKIRSTDDGLATVTMEYKNIKKTIQVEFRSLTDDELYECVLSGKGNC